MIKTADDLQGLAKFVNDYQGNFCSGKTFKLAPVDANGNPTDTLDMTGVNFTPIGLGISQYDEFWGIFDGGGKTISNLIIDSSNNCVGLFGAVHSGGKVQNVNLTNVNISGKKWGGGVVGLRKRFHKRLSKV